MKTTLKSLAYGAAACLFLTGCGRAPAINIPGSFFPAWMTCLTAPGNVFKEADALRDQVGKTVAAIRTMNDTVEYEFGVDQEPHIHLSQTMLRAALTAVALFWNQAVFLHNKRDRDLLNEPRLVDLRHKLAATIDAMADALAQSKAFIGHDHTQFVDPSLSANPRYKEYVQNAITRFRELQDYVLHIDVTG